jgi:hypothetical protein
VTSGDVLFTHISSPKGMKAWLISKNHNPRFLCHPWQKNKDSFSYQKMKSDRSTFLLVQSFYFVFRMKPLCQQAQNMGKKDRYQTNLRPLGTIFFTSESKVLCRLYRDE